MCSSSSDNGKKKRNTNTNNHSYFISNNNDKNGHINSNNNNNADKNNINKKNGKNSHNGNNNNKNGNNDKYSSSIASEISKDFKKIDFKYITDSFKTSSEELFEKIRNENQNTVNMIVNSFKEFQESQKQRDAEMEKKNMDSIYKMMGLMRYENQIFLSELEKKQNNLVKDILIKQNEENMSLLCSFILMLNDEGKRMKNKRTKKMKYSQKIIC